MAHALDLFVERRWLLNWSACTGCGEWSGTAEVRFNYTHRRMCASGADLRRHDSTLHARRVEQNCNVARFTKVWCGTAVRKDVDEFMYTAGDGTRWDRTGTRRINAGVCAATSLLGFPSCNCACATETWLAEASHLSCRSA